MSITEEYTRIGRGINKTMYHYKLQNLNDISKIEYYKTINDNVYLMIKSAGDTEIKRRKYAHLTIERINEHYLTVEHNLDPSVIIW